MRDYNRGLIKQIEELTEENERLKHKNKKLRAENRELRAENARLRKRLERLETEMEERINKTVEEAVAPLQAMIAEKDQEILRLRSQIGQNSSNSSRPSSSNGFKKIPNSREKSGKKQGGQKGHTGTRLNIAENLEELVAAGLAEHVVLSDVGDDEPYVSDWTIDIKIVTVFTERCRRPGEPPTIEYGPQLIAVAVYLSVIGLIAFKRLSQLFCEISHNLLRPSKATLAGFIRKTADRISLEQHIHDLLNGKVVHTDDTPIKTSQRPGVDGTLETAERSTFNAYIRTYSNERTTVLTANPRKTEQGVVADNILTRFHGIISQDHESKFYNFGDAHATCGAHLTRDLKGLSDLQMMEWAAAVREFFMEINKHKNHDVHNGITACEPVLLRRFEDRFDELLRLGKTQLDDMLPKSFGFDQLRRMVNRLEKHKDHYLLFMRDYDAPFTNNQAERDLRHCKTKQKISGYFRSWQGVLDYCKIRSLLDTAQKRQENLLDALSRLFPQGCPAGQ